MQSRGSNPTQRKESGGSPAGSTDEIQVIDDRAAWPRPHCKLERIGAAHLDYLVTRFQACPAVALADLVRVSRVRLLQVEVADRRDIVGEPQAAPRVRPLWISGMPASA